MELPTSTAVVTAAASRRGFDLISVLSIASSRSGARFEPGAMTRDVANRPWTSAHGRFAERSQVGSREAMSDGKRRRSGFLAAPATGLEQADTEQDHEGAH